ncbi:MAG: acetylglutamate kinase [Chryseolinea sp.]
MDKLFIVKIGGNVLDHPESLGEFLKDFSAIRAPKVLIHGGGKIATTLGNQLGIESHYIRGRRITDAQTLDLVTMVYGGLVNKQLVARLQAQGCNAFGVTGADGNLISAVKRPVKEIDYGYVGDIGPENVNTALLHSMLKLETTPVFASLTHADGRMLNTNADTIASVLAVALSKHFDVRLIFCFEKKGVLEDVGRDDSVIHHLSKTKYDQLLPGNVFTEGILPKLENAFAALDAGVREVLIGQAADLTRNTGRETAGTLITL